LLRKSGRADLARFRAAFAERGVRAVHLETPGVAAIIGGILLTFPGFITDALGAALFVPIIRRWTTARLATLARDRRQGRRDDRVIDLEPGEWRQIPDQRRRRRRKPKGSA
jgi:UPF0716 family protein affecting phage T7 exclusion